MADDTVPGSESRTTPTLGATLVRALLDRRGVARHRQAALVAQVLGLGYTQAHRRLVNAFPWPIEDVARMAQHFGESLIDVLVDAQPGHTHPGGPGKEAGEGLPAIFVLDGEKLPCEVWIGDDLETGRLRSPFGSPLGSPLVARRSSQSPQSTWEVLTRLQVQRGSGAAPAVAIPSDASNTAATTTATSTLRAVRRIMIVLDHTSQCRVAIVGEDPVAVDELRDQFRALALVAESFHGEESSRAALPPDAFDAYVIEWSTSKRTGHSLVQAVRAQDPQCPIALLAAHRVIGQSEEAAVVDAMQRWQLMFHEMPVRPAIVAVALKQALSMSKGGPKTV